MTCWQNFCMPSCDPNAEPNMSGPRCLAPQGAPAGVLLDACDPLATTHQCSSNLNCLRTALEKPNEGLCVPMRVCSSDAECPGNVKTTCGTTVLRDMLGSKADNVFTDHLLCVKAGCSDTNDCADDEGCLADYYSLYGSMPAICLANCDSQKQCPPDFACAQAGAPGAPSMCLPGVPGVRCTREDDCLVGDCTDTGAGFSVCTKECENDDECSAFDAGIYFRCVAGTPGGKKHCIAATPFHGSDCLSDDDCVDGTHCFHDSPYERVSTKSECRVPCDENARCPPRGGLAHTCLGPEGGCYPGDFGLPCVDSSDCMEPYTCEDITLEVGRDIVKQNTSDTSGSPLRICTIQCQDQQDSICNDVPALLKGSAYCAPDDRCHMSAPAGSPCTRNEQCASANCESDSCTSQPR
jgi:hypothetical protein